MNIADEIYRQYCQKKSKQKGSICHQYSKRNIGTIKNRISLKSKGDP